MKHSSELERQAALDVVKLMVAAARTAPKTRGIDNIEIIVVDDDTTKKNVLQKMREIAAIDNRPYMDRDANSCGQSPVFIVIGVRSNPAGLNCGYCGYRTCDELIKTNGTCAFNLIDLGISISSAASIASQLHVDNRVMYSIGRAALDMKLFGKDVRQALGIPLSVSGKNPFFDRK